MRLGYACINTSIGCTTNSTFRLASYSEDKLILKVRDNLDCFMKILEWNLENGIYFFRLGSGLIPFGSHEVCCFDWVKYFEKDFDRIGRFVKKNKMRISMHPDQFVVINSLDDRVVQRSVREIEYHCLILDSLGLGSDAKITIHVGGVYGDKEKAMERFVENYEKLSSVVKRRLVIENDHVSYSLKDCIEISRRTGIPVVFDFFHHECLNNGESFDECLDLAKKTWEKSDGRMIVHYSDQKKGAKIGSHSDSVDVRRFWKMIGGLKWKNFDLMLEVKDKERSLLNLRDSVVDKNKK